MKGAGKRQLWIGTSIRVVLREALSGFGCIMGLVNRVVVGETHSLKLRHEDLAETEPDTGASNASKTML